MAVLQLITITILTVGKILLCSCVGLFASRYFVEPEQSVKGLSTISVLIFLPCLLFSNLVLQVTWEELGQFYWAPLLACVTTIMGFVSSQAFKLFLHPEWHSVLVLGCTFQNGLTFSLSILLTIKGVSWLTPEERQRGLSYIFLYNIVCSLGLWGIGEPIIRSCKNKLEQKHLQCQQLQERAVEEERNKMRDRIKTAENAPAVFSPCERDHFPDENGTTTDIAGEEPAEIPAEGNSGSTVSNHDLKRIVRMATVEEQLAWYRPWNSEAPIQLGGVDHSSSFLGDVLSRVRTLLKVPPIVATIGALIFSLVPPLRWLAESPQGEALIGGMKLIGAGTIPLQLLILGCTVAAACNRSSNDNRIETTANEDDGESLSEGEMVADTPKEYIDCFPVSQSLLFAILTVVLRLILIPMVCFVIIHFLYKRDVIPSDRTFLLVILLGSCAPSAINSSLICSMHAYKARPYAQMIFIMYVSAVATTALWLAFYIWYLGE
ncbi:putative transporter [Trypanosoma rangeli]|uniref:Putative transporter n=1 Tax=Trypanosoma rangeli TaxID=5698 RepID=A0A422NMT2_TRYRA|nr:putative transporter [Trypanosoma rangeli]RNF06810.1 putative transporter [Trypanosoma rangeli]|eukprot:RNF06810.1 putative transporter [Trypanosoma rangeli]